MLHKPIEQSQFDRTLAAVEARLTADTTARSDAEGLREDAEVIRRTAERLRFLSEEARQLGETVRVAGEEARHAAEDARHATIAAVAATGIFLGMMGSTLTADPLAPQAAPARRHLPLLPEPPCARFATKATRSRPSRTPPPWWHANGLCRPERRG